MTADHLEETVKLLLLHRAPSVDDTSLNRKVDAIVDSYLAAFGTQTASKRSDLADAFRNKAPATLASERMRIRIERKGA
jgi:hypothetical protein